MSDQKQTPSPKHPLQTIVEEQQARAITQADVDLRMQRINEDFEKGFQLLRDHQDTVTFFGSARLPAENYYYQLAQKLAGCIVERLGATIVTGGGSGIMAAANHGATRAQGTSVGMTIELPNEQVTNDYVDESVDFYYFFSRKVALTYTARAYIYFPGGFGTLDEFFEIMTLKQTGKIRPIPVVLVGSDYWGPLLSFIEDTLRDQFRTISPGDTELYRLTDDIDEVIDAISVSSQPPQSKEAL